MEPLIRYHKVSGSSVTRLSRHAQRPQRPKSPRLSLRLRQLHAAGDVQAQPEDEATAALREIRRRREPARSPEAPDADLTGFESLDEKAPLISPILARDACRCHHCIDASDRQRNFSYADISPHISFQDVSSIRKNKAVMVRWRDDAPPHPPGHATTFDQETIARLKDEFRNWRRWSLYQRPQKLWDAASFTRDTSRIDFNDYMHSSASLAETLHYLWRDGLVFIDGVPESESSVAEIVNRIGPLQNTFYGPTWDVRSVPNAKNVAYTSKYLGFHMDLLYMRDPPGLQFLHCVHNSSQGGESRFADTFKAVDILMGQDREMVRALMTYPVRYEYDNDGFFYSDTKPTIMRRRQHLHVPHRRSIDAIHEHQMRDVGHVFWSPPFVGNLSPQMSHKDLASFVAASKAFADILERPENVVEEKMDSGTCVIFNNLRVVHARNAFDMNSGRRWLRGAYVNHQDFVSKAVSLMEEMPIHRFVGSHDPDDANTADSQRASV